jgi:hypothetical protein
MTGERPGDLVDAAAAGCNPEGGLDGEAAEDSHGLATEISQDTATWGHVHQREEEAAIWKKTTEKSI